MLALRYMSKRKFRTALTTLAILFGVMMMMGTGLLIPALRESVVQSMTAPGMSALRIEKISGEAFIPDTVLQAISSVDGVRAASGALRVSYAMPIPGVPEEERPIIEVVGVDPANAADVSSYPLSDGRFLLPDDVLQTVIPASLAEAFEVGVGQQLPLLIGGRLQFYTVAGLLDDRGLPKLMVIIPLAEAQTAFNFDSRVNTIDIAFESGTDRAALTEQVLAAVGADFQVNEDFDLESFDTVMAVGTNAMNVFAAMALFVGGFLIFNTFRTAEIERQHDLSVLRAIGAERGQITRLMLTESLIQGIIGTALGLVAGYLFAQALLYWSVDNGLTSTIGNQSPNAYELKLNIELLLFATVAGLGTTLIAGYFPAYRTGRVSPLAALRPMLESQKEKAARMGMMLGIGCILVAILLLLGGDQTVSLGGLMMLLGAALLAPTLIVPAMRLFRPVALRFFPQAGEIACGNILRQPGRSSVTVNTLMVGFAVFIASATLVASMQDYFVRMFTGAFVSDMIISPADNMLLIGSGEINPSSIVAPQLVAQLREHAAVESLTGVQLGTTAVEGEPFTLVGIEPEHAAELRPIYFREGEGEFENAIQALSTERAIVVSRITARELNLTLGDTLELNTPLSGTQTYTVAGIADDLYILPQAHGALLSQTNLAQDFGSVGDITVYIKLNEGATMDDLAPLLVDYPQLVLLDTVQFQEDAIKGGTDVAGFFYVLALIVVVPSLMGLVNTLTINVMERKREFGMVRAVGGDQGQVQRIVIAEALILGTLSAIVGIVVGLALSFGFVSVWKDIGGGMNGGLYVIFPTAGLITAFVGGFILTLLSSALPARHAARLDIIRALRYE
jgi:putative ABC transport system permease protein